MSICVFLFKIYVLQKQNGNDKWSEKDIIFKLQDTSFTFYSITKQWYTKYYSVFQPK